MRDDENRLGIGLGLRGLRLAMVIRQIRLEVDVAAKMGEEELVLLVQRDSGAEDAKVSRRER
jgi:hypothetical protein